MSRDEAFSIIFRGAGDVGEMLYGVIHQSFLSGAFMCNTGVVGRMQVQGGACLHSHVLFEVLDYVFVLACCDREIDLSTTVGPPPTP